MIVSHTEKEDFIDDMRLDTSSDIVDFFKRQSSYPAINIGHLGISVNHQRNGIGSAIIDLVADTFSNYSQAGCQFITVDALNNEKSHSLLSEQSIQFPDKPGSLFTDKTHVSYFIAAEYYILSSLLIIKTTSHSIGYSGFRLSGVLHSCGSP